MATFYQTDDHKSTILMPRPARGLAAAGTIGATATMANAVADALAPLGIKITDLPLSPERIANLAAGADAGRER